MVSGVVGRFFSEAKPPPSPLRPLAVKDHLLGLGKGVERGREKVPYVCRLH